MFMLESPPSRKRRRVATSSVDLERSLIAKKQRLTPDEKLSQNHKRRACFWDTLSKIRLTRGALKEFDRRCRQEKSPLCLTNAQTQTLDYPEGQKLQQLRSFARVGGPDLSHLRGVSLFYIEMNHGDLQYLRTVFRVASSCFRGDEPLLLRAKSKAVFSLVET